MKLDVAGLQAFIAIAERGSFGRAAGSLHITQTGLTRRLQKLEEALGVRLVERTTRSTALSTIGRAFLPRARRLVEDLTAAFAEVRESGKAMRGDVTIACVPTVGVHYLPRIVQRYAARHPDNRVRILDHASADVAQAVLSREAEFGINILGSHHPDLAGMPLVDDRFVLVCRDDHPLARREALAWRSLEPHALIYVGQMSGNRHLLDDALARAQVSLRFRFEVQRSSTAVGLVAEGVGAAIVPRLAVQKGAYPRLRVVALREPVVSRTLVLVSRRNAELSPAAAALHELIASLAARRRGTRLRSPLR
ncbi:MAG TPA: LysR family transcriptional regulator [Usitatibacter sp.]|nr:LysR family transcriptional regulator [Usitatibacter sp.]